MKKIEAHRVEPHEKSWGVELWIDNNTEYCGKVLVFEKDTHTSMHFHMNKRETMYLVSGKVKIKFTDTQTGKAYDVDLEPGHWIRIDRGQPHMICAEEPSRVIEFSTPHEDKDSYRVSESFKEK